MTGRSQHQPWLPQWPLPPERTTPGSVYIKPLILVPSVFSFKHGILLGQYHDELLLFACLKKKKKKKRRRKKKKEEEKKKKKKKKKKRKKKGSPEQVY
ncbi:hypothetical protein SprV_0200805100 [Sparganum proliferum]